MAYPSIDELKERRKAAGLIGFYTETVSPEGEWQATFLKGYEAAMEWIVNVVETGDANTFNALLVEPINCSEYGAGFEILDHPPMKDCILVEKYLSPEDFSNFERLLLELDPPDEDEEDEAAQ